MERHATNVTDYLKRNKYVGIIMIIVIAALVLMFFKNPKYFSVANILTIINSIPAPAILAFGFTFVLITGGIDLSCGYGVTLCIIVMGVALDNGASPIVGCLTALATGLAIGLVNGVLIVLTKIPPFIVTLATMSAAQGMVNLWFPTRVKVSEGVFHTIGYGKVFGGFPVSAILMIICFVIALLLLKKTKIGVYTYALGSNEKNARLSGINTGFYKAIVYVICGICMGLTGIILSSRVAVVQKTTGGNSLLMDVVTAAVLGGNRTGGEGGVVGTFIGIILLQMLSNAMVLLNVSGDGQDIVKGIMIISGLVLMNWMDKNRN